jgi:hypothetical protein
MSVFTMTVWIVTVVMIAQVLKARYEARQADARLDDDTLARLERIDELEARVRVLEKIVTDRNYDLRRQLDDLDRPA